MKLMTIFKKKRSAVVTGSLVESGMYELVSVDFSSDYVQRIIAEKPRIIVLDFLSACIHVDDVQVIQGIRKVSSAPICMVVPPTTPAAYREAMFDAGIDGCVQAPFLDEEFLMRLKTLHRKTNSLLFEGTVITSGSVRINLATHTVYNGPDEVYLTKTEYGIFLHLMIRRRAVVSSQVLMQHVRLNLRTVSTVLNVHILNIRKKLRGLNIIHTVPRQGFYIS